MFRSSLMTATCIGLLTLGGIANPSLSAASQVSLQVGVVNPTMLAGSKQTNYVRISLTGFDLPQPETRPPVNVAIVIDTSGSMNGTKIGQAREAAIAAVKRLRDNDVVSVILYNSSVQVLVPATKATDRQQIIQQIRSVKASGNTALFAGVSKGAAEVRKFIDKDSVNRVILLSDGLANVGPSTPRDLERLGRTLVKEGISVSTLGLGLGYNEDLMSSLAAAGSGNHIFVEDAENLIAVFNNEFNDLMSVVAGDFKIHARVGPGVRPVRVLGTRADITGQQIHIPLAQLYANQQRYFVLEVEVDANESGDSMSLVNVEVEYQNLITETKDKVSSDIEVRFNESIAIVQRDLDVQTQAYCAVQIANERNIQATALRDAGEVDAAKKLLNQNVIELRSIQAICVEQQVTEVIPELELNINLNYTQADYVEGKDWNRGRKIMRAQQNQIQSQQVQPSPPQSNNQ
ncbi:MAG: VWA domain-containing protein [Rubripirellula sp.]|nr:VWA domain-containing protein [Rubripirellula sp.]